MIRTFVFAVFAVFATAAAAHDQLEIRRGTESAIYEGNVASLIQRGGVGTIEFDAETVVHVQHPRPTSSARGAVPSGDWDINVIGAGGDAAEHCGLDRHEYRRYPSQNQFIRLICEPVQ